MIRFLAIIFFLASVPVFAQSADTVWHLQDSIALRSLQQVSIDRYGNLYLSSRQGNIHRLDSTGQHPLTFSPDRIASVSLLEARNPLSIFAFYRDLQQYTILNRFLTPTEVYRFDTPEINFVRVAAPAADNQLWLVDDMDFAIKKFSPQLNRVSLQIPLDLLLKGANYDISYLSEYQNQLFVLDRNSGILVFDNMGNYRRKIQVQGIDYFNFLGEEIYYVKDNKVYFLHLYQTGERIISLPDHLQGRINKVLLQQHRIFLFATDGLWVYHQ